MEPDVIRMYSSSPPPLDDAPEEEDEEFGDFGGFSGVASGVSFGEFDSPKGFCQSRATDASPPARVGETAAGFTPGGTGRGSGAVRLRSDREPCDPGCSHASPLPDRMFDGEAVRKPAPGAQVAGGGRPESHARDCNRDIPAAEGLNNGFGPFEAEDAPVVRPKKRGPAAKPTLDCCGHRPVTGPAPADSSRLCSVRSDAPLYTNSDASQHANGAPGGKSLPAVVSELHSGTGLAKTSLVKKGLEDSVHSTASASLTAAPLAGLNDEEWGSSSMGAESERGNPELRTECPSSLREPNPAGLNGAEEGGAEDECVVGPRTVSSRTVSSSVSDDFASFCQAVSPDGLEDFGDFSTMGFAAPPFLEGEEPPSNRTNEEGYFGDFGQTEPEMLERVADLAARPTTESTDVVEFGGSEVGESRKEGEDGQGEFAGFPGSDCFADFSSAPMGAEPESPAGWSAFGQPEEAAPGGGCSWTAFRAEQGAVLVGENEETSWDAAVTAPPSGCPQTCRRDSFSASLASRLEKLFRVSFPVVGEPEAGEEVPSLRTLLEPADAQLGPGEERSSASHSTGQRDVWWRLQDIHDAFGLRYQWGGSHSSRVLLCSLGIDNRNMLCTGQKKQHVTVPPYAASLGMLEPTKDPVSPLSAAEKIASIAQAPSTSPEMSTSPDSTQQEALLPIQFDWSSSGLTNPLDGKLTTAKLETSNTSSLPALISVVGRTCSSSRKPRQDGALSEEAARVMVALPDLSFMLARVLMFPVAVT